MAPGMGQSGPLPRRSHRKNIRTWGVAWPAENSSKFNFASKWLAGGFAEYVLSGSPVSCKSTGVVILRKSTGHCARYRRRYGVKENKHKRFVRVERIPKSAWSLRVGIPDGNVGSLNFTLWKRL